MPRLTVIAAALLLVACTAQPSATASTVVPTATPSALPTSPPTPPATATASSNPPGITAVLEAKRVSTNAPGIFGLVRTSAGDTFVSAGTATVDRGELSAATTFRIGSITKPVVGALVLIAVRDGLFRLDDKVGDLVPGVLRPTPDVTVRQLLAHTSGVFDEGNEGDMLADVDRISDDQLRAQALALVSDYQAGRPVRMTDRIWIALAETHNRYNAPGRGYHYSNVGYQVLGMILEKTSGQSLADLLRSQIVEPLGLTRTYLAPTDQTTPDMHGYARAANGDLTDITDDLSWFGNGGNGGVVSTPEELMTLMQAMVSGRLLGDDLTAEMKEVHLASYGLGLATYELSCGMFYGHGGSVVGTQSIALISEDATTGVVAAINVKGADDPQLSALADTLVCAAR